MLFRINIFLNYQQLFLVKTYHIFITVYIILNYILTIELNLNLDIQAKVIQTILSTTEWE